MRPVVALLVLLAACTRSFIEDESRVEILRNLAYAEVDDQPLLLDLLLPHDRLDPAPLVVWLHGGSWLFGTHHDCRIDWLAERGYAVASIGYRTSLEAKWPAQLHDAKAAVRWLRANAARYRLRTGRIAAAGMSSGGHIALMLGLTKGTEEGDLGSHPEESSSIEAVISYYGPTDLVWYDEESKLPHLSTQPIPLLLGATPRENPELARAASPLYWIHPGAPPVLLIQGEDDFIVPPVQSERFHARYRAAHLSSELVMVPDAGHYGGRNYFGRKGPREPVLNFLRRTIGE